MKSIKNITVFVLLLLAKSTYSQCSSKIVCGSYHTFIQKTNNTLWIFGAGSIGNLGNGTDTDEYSPFQLTASTNWQQIVCGAYNTFAIKTDGTLWGTGNNYLGELGTGSTIDHLSVLTQIGTANNWKQIAPSNYFTIALKTDNSLWGWGQNNNYQMGDGSCCSNRLAPGPIGTTTDWRMAAVSNVGTAFALKNNGTLWAWGNSIGGLLGDNLQPDIPFPTQHNTDTDWQNITLGTAHILALKTNGTLWSWGAGGQGQTGDGLPANYNRYTPLQIGTSTWRAVAAGQNTSYGIKTDGTLWGWGQNDVG